MPRKLAQQVLELIEVEDAYSHIALDAALQAGGLTPRDRALATELVYGTLTWQRALDTLLAGFLNLDGGPDALDRTVRVALRLGAYQLVFLDKIPPHAAVHEAVELVKHSASRRASGLVNAVLRNLSRSETPRVWWRDEDRHKKPARYVGQRYSMPNWLASRVIDTWGMERAEAMAEAFTLRPRLYLRACGDFAAQLPDAVLPDGVHAHRSGAGVSVPGALWAESMSEDVRAGLGEGRWVVQDLGSQLIGLFSGAAPGVRVLDACAGLGGKTLHLAEMVGPDGQVVALDPVPSKLDLLRASAEQMGLANRIITRPGTLQDYAAGDEIATQPAFDLVLVDAPCTGLGVIRRHPETRWRRQSTDIAQLAALQAELLDAAAALVRPGGTLLYSVCTFTREEGPQQVADFLARHPAFRPAGAPTEGPGARVDWRAFVSPALASDAGVQLQLNPLDHDTDGFFAARMTRQ